MNKEQLIRKEVRSVLHEEVSPDVKKSVREALEREIRDCMDDVLMRHNVHKKGLSEGQIGWMFRKLNDVVRDKLDEYQTSRMPSDPDLRKAVEDYHG